MIQRIQSVYLLVAVAVTSAAFFLPFLTASGAHFVYRFLPIGARLEGEAPVVDFPPVWLAALPLALVVVLGVVVIISYGNRKRQMQLNRLLLILLLAAMGTEIGLRYGIAAALADAEPSLSVGFGLGLILLPVVVILVFLANRAIAKDEALVRSVDRLR